MSKDFSRAIGRAIKVIRTDLGIERRDLAETVGISYSYLTEIENGNKPASSNVLRPIASALGLRLSQLTEAAEMRLEGRLLSMDSSMDGDVAADLADTMPYMALESSPPGDRVDVLAREALPIRMSSPSDSTRHYLALQPSLRSEHRELRHALLELERLLERMAPDDIERLLDYARRLSR